MSDYKKRKWLKDVTVIIDSREKSNEHITNELDRLNVKWCIKKLDFGDYSFVIDGVVFSKKCVVERKNSVLELYGNIIELRPNTDNWKYAGQRIKAEIQRAEKCGAQLIFLIEGVESMREIKNTVLDRQQLKKYKFIKCADIGKRVFAWLKKVQQKSKCGLRVEFANPKESAAARILEEFWYFYSVWKEEQSKEDDLKIA